MSKKPFIHKGNEKIFRLQKTKDYRRQFFSTQDHIHSPVRVTVRVIYLTGIRFIKERQKDRLNDSYYVIYVIRVSFPFDVHEKSLKESRVQPEKVKKKRESGKLLKLF